MRKDLCDEQRLLNVPLRPEGVFDDQEERLLAEIGEWMKVNGEAIYGTRPWHLFGEGPTKLGKGQFTELTDTAEYGPADIRFTTKGAILYAICLGVPNNPVNIRSLGSLATSIRRVSLLGSNSAPAWKIERGSLVIQSGDAMQLRHAVAFRLDPS